MKLFKVMLVAAAIVVVGALGATAQQASQEQQKVTGQGKGPGAAGAITEDNAAGAGKAGEAPSQDPKATGSTHANDPGQNAPVKGPTKGMGPTGAGGGGTGMGAGSPQR
jgi:hypothetical protein